jgi:glycosyltransferase involved in cell wall biosynthesis
MSGNRKPGVLFLNHWAQRMGGAELSLGDILGVAKDLFDCHLVTTETGPLTQRAAALNITVHLVPCPAIVENLKRSLSFPALALLLRAWWAYLHYVNRLWKLCAAVQPDLIHANVPKSHIALFLLKRRGYRGKCVLHIREIFKKHSLPYFLYAILFPGRGSDVIAISHAVKNALPRRMKKCATVIHNGILISSSEKEYHAGDKVSFLYLGRVVPWKGCHLLIDVFSILWRAYPRKKITLSIVGDSLYGSAGYKNRLQEQISRHHLESVCQLYPHTSDPESLYLSHDVFCTASVDEPFGRNVAEAQGCAMPVIGFDSGGLREIVVSGETGILAPESDVPAFALACGRVIENPGCIETMGKAGKRRATALFDRITQLPLICQHLRNQVTVQGSGF